MITSLVWLGFSFAYLFGRKICESLIINLKCYILTHWLGMQLSPLISSLNTVFRPKIF